MSLVHTLFTALFIEAFDAPKSPIRGDVTLIAYLVSAYLALFFFLILLYIIVDQMRLCRALARMSVEPKLKWPKPTLRKYSKKLDIKQKKNYLSCWLSDQFLSKRTQAIHDIEYYPAIILGDACRSTQQPV